MKIGTTKELRQGENRVALSPTVCKQFIKNGFECYVEKGAGENSFFSDASYAEAGATVLASAKDIFQTVDVLCKVNPLSDEEITQLRPQMSVISFAYHLVNQALVEKINAQKATLISMDAIPRISRAQSMDALSSQANLAGYKAVIVGANESGRIFPMLMTAAGTITPSKVLIFGAGVAGLQAVGTAKRLGAVVEVTDIRPETKEEVESLGGKFISFEMGDVKIEGGYVKEAGESVLQKQREILKKHLATADVVVTTALIPGRKAPVLITADMVDVMKPGSIIVDMAVEQGGNCELSEMGKMVVHNGVKITGYTNFPSMLPSNSSEAYAKNMFAFLSHLATKDGMKWDMNDEITVGTLICRDGNIVRS
jgi:H+-translocating NAD(P) transhydrogenase subunit alpha